MSYNQGGYRGNSGGGRGNYSGGNGGGNPSNFDDFKLDRVDWEKELKTLPKFEKDFYKESKESKEMSEKDIQTFRDKHEMKIFGKGVPTPMLTFSSTCFPDTYVKVLSDAGFKGPTPIQSQAWPICLKGNDIISLAETGSGKTLGFLMPGIVHMSAQPKLERGDGPIMLVLAPTRELAMQIDVEAEKFAGKLGFRSCCVYGGGARGDQVYKIKKGVEIIIATPGRLLDLISSKIVSLARITYLVLDEADRMLDMGFEPQIRKIINGIRPDRQTLMWSATWNKEVQALASDFLTNPIIINIGSVDVTANTKVLQKFLFIQEGDKESRLVKIVDELMDGRKILIFTATKRGSDDITTALRYAGWPALCIHGDKTQKERDWVMGEFRKGTSPIMVATDVAARGLDINDIKLVINYDMPKDIETYVHRIGRTARAGNTGASMSFFTSSDAGLGKRLKDLLIDAKQEIPAQLEEIITNNRGGGGHGGGGYRSGGYKRKHY
jgi:ATP-dependent RNA helicase DDX5/DBP2